MYYYLHWFVLGGAVDGELCHVDQVEDDQEGGHQLAGRLAGGAGAERFGQAADWPDAALHVTREQSSL